MTTEANPDSVTAASLGELAAGRVHPGVVRHAVGRALACWRRSTAPTTRAGCRRWSAWARDAGLQVSLDLIYGTPGETDADWLTSLDAVTSLAPDHVSAYALVVEEGTALAAQVRRGRVPEPGSGRPGDPLRAGRRGAGRGRAWTGTR